jgi:replicative DNA helicase
MDTEKVVVGMIILNPDNLYKCQDVGLRPEHFDGELTRLLYTSICTAEAAKEAYDLVSLGTKYPDHVSFITDCTTSAPVSQNIKHYAKEVMCSAWVRSHLQGFSEITRLFMSRKPFETLEQLQTAKSQVPNWTFGQTTDDGQAFTNSIAIAWTETIEQQITASQKGNVAGIPTGLRTLDNATSGFWPGTLNILAARTSVGKTTLALNWAYHAAKMGKTALFFTVEMDKHELFTKFVSRSSKLVGSSIRKGDLSEEECDRLMEGVREISALPLAIVDNFGTSLERLEDTARRFKRRGECDIIFVDYLQLLKPAGRFNGRTAEVAEISVRLKILAKSLQVPVVALAQINRDFEKYKTESGPEMHQLKDSGSIEQDADTIMIINREGKGDLTQYFLKVAKNRAGITSIGVELEVRNDINYWTEKKTESVRYL